MAPIYDTTDRADERGIHVHARKAPDEEKEIDQTYPAVALRYRRDLLEERRIVIGEEAAINYYVTRFLGKEVSALFCNYCGELHLDAGYFAIHPHRRHLCHGCGKFFQVENRGISNPIEYLRSLRPDVVSKQKVERSVRTLDIKQADASGGIQIWASNPAIFWTAARAEEEGIHVHA